MILPIVTGDKQAILRSRAAKIPALTKAWRKLAKDMAETMEQADGVGLAAPQVAVGSRVIVVKIKGGGRKVMILAMFNPQILDRSAESTVMEEGCLSLPGLFLPVRRAAAITVSFWDERGETRVLKLSGLNARVVQHEVDHLDGVLITDRAATDQQGSSNQGARAKLN